MKRISIKTRVFILALIPTLIISLLLGTFLITSRINALEQEQRIYAFTLINHIINISRNGLYKNDRHALQDIIDILPDERELESVAVFNKKHEVVAYGGATDPQALAKVLKFDNNTPTTHEHSGTLTLVAPVVIDNLKIYTDNDFSQTTHTDHKQVVGWVAITLSRSKVILEEYQIVLITLMLLTAGLIISMFFAMRTTRFIINPLLHIRNAIKNIENGKLETRINTNTSDELNELEDGINKMAASMQKAHDELQANVEKATYDLKQSLSTIETQNTILASAQKEALEASHIKSEFIANMSHEIRTPMNSIVGYTNLLLETELSLLQRNYLTIIQKSTLNLLNLVNNVLDLSRLDAGQLKLDYIPFDLHDCIEDILCIMSPLANSKQLEFASNIDKKIPRTILSDPLRIKQIIINLVSNAIKFTETGEIIIHATLEKRSHKSNRIRIAVSDTGIGMSPHDQRGIFRAFQQADTSIARKYGGTGLGLAICKKLVDQMGGKIGVESHQDRGSTFWFIFTSEKLAQEDETEKDIFSSQHAYLYEPHPITRQALHTMLSQWGIKVSEFQDVETLSQALITSHQSSTAPFCVIAGINQHHIQNNSASKLIQQLKQQTNAPLIVLTNSSEQAVLEYFKSHGANASISKPVLRKQLFDAISDLTKVSQISTPSPYQSHHIDLSNYNILCVDDNPHNAILVQALLENTKANIVIAHDGLEATSITDAQKFDLILMDLRMPKLDGYEAIKIIRESHSNKNNSTPIIAISAHISDDEQQSLLKAGFNSYLTKPIEKQSLLEAIQRWLHIVQNETITTNNQLQPSPLVIDWKLAIKLAGNKREIAEEMFFLLIKNLPEDVSELKKSYESNDYVELQRRVHKLYGALCYCGAPRLKNAARELEVALKKQWLNEIPSLFNKLTNEIHLVLQEMSATQ